MPKCLVCYKWTLDEKDIKIKPEDLSLDTSRAKGKISDFDRNAIEEATLIVEQQGGSVDALTYGTSAVQQSLKDVLSRGPDTVCWIADGSAETADACVTANVLASAIRKLGSYDLILCGEGSSDLFNQQTAARIAALLDLPCVTYVEKLSVEGNTVKATRKLADCTEVATVKGPVVLSVLGTINKPRIPSLKQVLGAAKKPKKEIKNYGSRFESGTIAAQINSQVSQRVRRQAQEHCLQRGERRGERWQADQQPGRRGPAVRRNDKHGRNFCFFGRQCARQAVAYARARFEAIVVPAGHRGDHHGSRRQGTRRIGRRQSSGAAVDEWLARRAE